MNPPVLSSTLLLTLLLLVGLFFFVKASVKERLQQAQFIADQSQESLSQALRQYFKQRAYQIIAVDPDPEQVTLEGLVRPSIFLAGFLTLLAALGLLCLGLVLSVLLPQVDRGFWGLILLAPLAGAFYWQGAKRLEQVKFKVEPLPGSPQAQETRLTVTAHRDEIIALQRSFKLRGAD